MLTQSHYHFGVAEGSESTYRLLAAEDRPTMIAAGRDFLCRIGVQSDGTAHNNQVLQWQYQHNGGGWNNITTTSSVVRTGATSIFTNAQHCTKRLSGTGTFEASAQGCTHDGSAGGAANDIVANGNSETLIGLRILGGDTAIGDLIELRIANMGAYAAIPAIRVGAEILPIQSRDARQYFSLSAGGQRITDKETTIRCVGMSNADLADSTLSMTMNVWGTTSTDPSPPDSAYDVPLQGPDVWSGGATGKAGTDLAGLPIPPGFSFHQEIAPDIRRVRASFEPSRAVVFGADAAIVTRE